MELENGRKDWKKDPRVLALLAGLALTVLIVDVATRTEPARPTLQSGFFAQASYLANRKAAEAASLPGMERKSSLGSILPFPKEASPRGAAERPLPPSPVDFDGAKRDAVRGVGGLFGKAGEGADALRKKFQGLRNLAAGPAAGEGSGHEHLRDSLHSSGGGASSGAFLSLASTGPGSKSTNGAATGGDGLISRVTRSIMSHLSGSHGPESRLSGRNLAVAASGLADSKASFPEASALASSSSTLPTTPVTPLASVPGTGKGGSSAGGAGAQDISTDAPGGNGSGGRGTAAPRSDFPVVGNGPEFGDCTNACRASENVLHSPIPGMHCRYFCAVPGHECPEGYQPKRATTGDRNRYTCAHVDTTPPASGGGPDSIGYGGDDTDGIISGTGHTGHVGGTTTSVYNDAGPKVVPFCATHQCHKATPPPPPPPPPPGPDTTPPAPPPTTTGITQDTWDSVTVGLSQLVDGEGGDRATFQPAVWPLFDAIQDMSNGFSVELSSLSTRLGVVEGHIQLAKERLGNQDDGHPRDFCDFAISQLQGEFPAKLLQLAADASNAFAVSAALNQGTLEGQSDESQAMEAIRLIDVALGDNAGALQTRTEHLLNGFSEGGYHRGINDYLGSVDGGWLGSVYDANDPTSCDSPFCAPGADVGVQIARALGSLIDRLKRDPWTDVADKRRRAVLDAKPKLESLRDALALIAVGVPTYNSLQSQHVQTDIATAAKRIDEAVRHLENIKNSTPQKDKGQELIEATRRVTAGIGWLVAAKRDLGPRP